MSMGQTMLASAFLVLLTVAVINANKMIVEADTSHYEHEALEQAGYLANSLLTEIVRKKFDEKADTSLSVRQPDSVFTLNSNLGPDVYSCQNWYYNYEGWLVSLPDRYPYQSVKSEVVYSTSPLHSHNGYNDIDDYNGYIRLADAGNIEGFRLTVKVFYVLESNPNVTTTSRTYLKKIEVTVSNTKYLKNDIVYSTIVAY